MTPNWSILRDSRAKRYLRHVWELARHPFMRGSLARDEEIEFVHAEFAVLLDEQNRCDDSRAAATARVLAMTREEYEASLE